MTKKRVIRVVLWVGVALSLGTWAIGQTPVTLTGAGNNVYDGVYVSPYYATVNGVANTTVICDDFADNSYLNTPAWGASTTKFSSLSSTSIPTAWGAKDGAFQSTLSLYDDVAWLSLQLLQQPTGTSGVLGTQDEYSFAIWAVFDPSGVLSWLQTAGPNGTPDTALCLAIFGNSCTSDKATGGLLANLPTSFSPGEFANVLIISPDKPGTNTVCAAGNCPEQEFIEVVPEGGAPFVYLLLAGLCCFGAIRMRARRQIGSTTAA